MDRVSEITRLTWPEVYSMAIIETLNIYSYALDKAAEERRQLKGFKG